jgi:hypothetical protein
MITLPDRLSKLIKQVESASSEEDLNKILDDVETKKFALLQALDLVQVGRKFMEEAVTLHDEFVTKLEQELTKK